MPPLPAPLTRLRLPIIVAPMFLTSDPGLVIAACNAGLLGSFPALNQRDSKGFDDWLSLIRATLAAEPDAAPFAVNLIVHKTNPRLKDDLAVVLRHRVPVVITAFGLDPDLIKAVHAYGGIVLHDVASRRHAERAAEAGVDGVIVLGAGAGGHTGHLSPFAAVAEARQVFDGLIILAGAISSGADIAAARAIGADLVSMGTRFIATQEAGVSAEQKAMMIAARSADVVTTAALTGNAANFLGPSLFSAGIDPANPSASPSARPWRDIWSAGQGVVTIGDVPTVAELAQRLGEEYRTTLHRLAADPFLRNRG